MLSSELSLFSTKHEVFSNVEIINKKYIILELLSDICLPCKSYFFVFLLRSTNNIVKFETITWKVYKNIQICYLVKISESQKKRLGKLHSSLEIKISNEF